MPPESIIIAFLACLILQTGAWLWQIKTQNADIVDITWSVSIVICTLIFFRYSSDLNSPKFLVLLFPGLWYARLSYHLIKRYRVDHEDNRYKHLREHWSQNTQLKFFGFFIFQAVLSVIFSLPAYWLSIVTLDSNSLITIGCTLGVLSLIGVTIADHQLFKFKDNPLNKKEVCNIGLWKYSRHPNYFFEWTHWFVYPIFLWGTAYFYPAIVIAVLMYIFLLYLTGIPFSEQQSLINRGDMYSEYQSRTNKFFPWRPKKT